MKCIHLEIGTEYATAEDGITQLPIQTLKCVVLKHGAKCPKHRNPGFITERCWRE